MSLFLLIACGSELTPKTFNDLPTISIMQAETTYAQGEVAEYRAQAGDSNHAVSELLVSWYVDDQLICDWQEVDALGVSSCSITFPASASKVLAQVVDPDGGGAQDEVVVNVVPSEPPVILLSSPVDGAFYYAEQLLSFAAAVYDQEDAVEDLSIQWSSSLDGDLQVDTQPDSDGRIEGAGFLSEGQHMIQLAVVDTAGLRSSASVMVTVGPANEAPSCAITAPQSGENVLVGEQLVFAADVDDAELSSTELSIEWSSDQDGLLGSATASSSGEVIFPYSALSVNSHTITLEVHDEAGGVCSDIMLLHVGSAPNVVINQPITGDVYNLQESLSFLADVSDAQDTAEQLTVVWESDRMGELHNQTATSGGTSAFSAADLVAGMHWITATVYDSTGFSASQAIQLRINTPPQATTVEISPPLPTTMDSLQAVNITVNDVDGDALTYAYQWYVNGALTTETTATVSAAMTTKDETWMVRVTPNDGFADGNLVEATVVIANSAPTAPTSVAITPTSPSAADDLLCTASGSADADGDGISYHYSWSGNGQVWSGDTLPQAYTEEGDSWVCEAYASDGTAASSVVTSTAVTILESPITTDCDECVDLGNGVIAGFVEIPAGSLPSHSVYLSNDFYILTTEVSQGMFEALMQYNDASFSSCGVNCPMENITWHEAAAFANALSDLDGRAQCYSCSYANAADPSTVSCSDNGSYGGQNIYNCPGYRLPTDAEWEYVARATVSSDMWTATGGGSISVASENSCQSGVTLSDGTVIADLAWYCANAGSQPQDIAQRQANGFGVYDMHGNVFEWCQDWYDVWWQIGVNPVNTSGTTKLMRGGAWDTEPYELRANYREHNWANSRHDNVGFRVVRTGP